MTGFARVEAELSSTHRAEVTIRSVNHKNLDLQVRAPSELAPLEAELRRRVGAVCRRGRVEISIRLRGASVLRVAIDRTALAALVADARAVGEEFGLAPPTELAPLLALPGVVAGAVEEPISEAASGELLQLVERTLAAFDAEREREGAGLTAVLSALVGELARRRESLVAARADWTAQAAAALRARIAALAAEVALDSGRLEQEVAILAEKADVTEELDRLELHLARTRELLGGRSDLAKDGGTGRALDFLAQELTREVGTCGAKLRHPDASRLILEMKGIVEKVREQVQNLE